MDNLEEITTVATAMSNCFSDVMYKNVVIASCCCFSYISITFFIERFFCVSHVEQPVVLSAKESEVNSRLLASDQYRSLFFFFCFFFVAFSRHSV